MTRILMGLGACVVLMAPIPRFDIPKRIILCANACLSDIKSDIPLPNPFKLSKIRWDTANAQCANDIAEMMIPGGSRYPSTPRGSDRVSFLEIRSSDVIALRMPMRSVSLGEYDIITGPADVKMPISIHKDHKIHCSLEFTHHPVLTRDLQLRVYLAHEA